MTEQELFNVSSNDSLKLIMGPIMKDVAFWPISIKVTETHYELNGIWYSNVVEDLISIGSGQPARETIKIKKEDLQGWKIKD